MCQIQLDKVYHLVNDAGLNRYSLYLDCAGGIPPHADRFKADLKNIFKFYKFEMPKFPTTKKNGTGMQDLLSTHGMVATSHIPCIDVSAETNYLNQASVRKALHIPETVQDWQVCSDEVGNNYQSTYKSMHAQYRALVTKYRGLVYNGDTDMACNFLGDQWFVESLQLKETQARKQWLCDNQIAGFYHRFQNLTYTTVKGAGHMVPQWKPRQALQMLNNFLDGKM
ncbi:lysosomal protective protein-like isoform X2 [Ptychodera flava]|uniref:lysosomal protective protein-like isoform X2 n=1 Tax=Ptychodera flava TaxID=63121 RepID=UPI00396A994E